MYGKRENTEFIEEYLKKLQYEQMALFDKLNSTLGTPVFSTKFERDFFRLSIPEQQSIITRFEDATKRKLPSPFYPDAKLIKDVTPDKPKCNVYELRIYTPTAIRVYFNEGIDNIYVASIEKKSNPDQNKDIAKAHKAIAKLLN